MKDDVIYLDWEYHPVYGSYSRVVFVRISKDSYEMTREFKR